MQILWFRPKYRQFWILEKTAISMAYYIGNKSESADGARLVIIMEHFIIIAPYRFGFLTEIQCAFGARSV